jgi:hypothetical protein
MPRLWGGYENLYQVSAKGWKRIAYIQQNGSTVNMPPREETFSQQQEDGQIVNESPAGEVFLKDMFVANYCQEGFGRLSDIPNSTICKWLCSQVPGNMAPITDEMGIHLTCLSPSFIFVEHSRQMFGLANSTLNRTLLRAGHLRDLGYVPSNINLPIFVQVAMQLGNSETCILMDLLLRRIRELRQENSELKTELPNPPRSSYSRFIDSCHSELIVIYFENQLSALLDHVDTLNGFLERITDNLIGLQSIENIRRSFHEYTQGTATLNGIRGLINILFQIRLFSIQRKMRIVEKHQAAKQVLHIN